MTLHGLVKCLLGWKTIPHAKLLCDLKVVGADDISAISMANYLVSPQFLKDATDMCIDYEEAIAHDYNNFWIEAICDLDANISLRLRFSDQCSDCIDLEQ